MSSLQPLHPAAPTDHDRQPLLTTTTPDTLGLHEYLKGVIQLQHRSIDQANANCLEAREARKADAIRIARLEESIRSISIQPETKGPSLEPRYSDCVNLQRFRSSDGPIYSGPFQAVEPFISWIRGVQIFFVTKAVSHDDNKIRKVGGLIWETNTLAFYASSVENYVGQPWSLFKAYLLAFALPPLWRTELRVKLRDLRMTGTESFLNYSTRARTLQSMLNFDAGAISDFTLAESMTLGMPADLQAEVNNHQLLLADPFAFGTFESRSGVFWNGIVKRKTATKTQIPSLAPNPSSHKNHQAAKRTSGGFNHIWIPSGCAISVRKPVGAPTAPVPGNAIDPSSQSQTRSNHPLDRTITNHLMPAGAPPQQQEEQYDRRLDNWTKQQRWRA